MWSGAFAALVLAVPGTAASAGGTKLGPPKVLSTSTPSITSLFADEPGLAYDGTHFLAAWHDDAAVRFARTGADLVAPAETAVPLPVAADHFGARFSPVSVARSGNHFLIAFSFR